MCVVYEALGVCEAYKVLRVCVRYECCWVYL